MSFTVTAPTLNEQLQLQIKSGRPIVGLVATKNPVEALKGTVKSLFDGGACAVLVVNDGSDDPISLTVLKEVEQLGAHVLNLPENVGKSTALRAGFSALPLDKRIIIAQTDDDTLAGDLRISASMIMKGKTDIVDIRVETFEGQNLIGLIQQLDYWLINATIKRVQDLLRSRLWLSGASVMYTYEAAKVLLMEPCFTQTEDTEGRFRAIGAGLKVRYCSNRDAEFKTMVPETLGAVRSQWQRWALGNGQVLKLHGFGGGSKRVAFVNLASWVNMFVSPIIQFFAGTWIKFLPWAPYIPGTALMSHMFFGGFFMMLLWIAIFGVIVGLVGAIALRRFVLLGVGVFIPLLSLWWTFHALEGLVAARKQPEARNLTWISPERMVA
jgi:cellulose synthase/poly-beta-1,6-N-acetylglucosamine synthase-like glycosyltransferase